MRTDNHPQFKIKQVLIVNDKSPILMIFPSIYFCIFRSYFFFSRFESGATASVCACDGSMPS